MSPIYLRIQSGGPQIIQVSMTAQLGDAAVGCEATHENVDTELIEELAQQLAAAGPLPYPCEQLSRHLGAVLFEGEFGETFRGILRRNEASALFLEAEGQCAV